MATPRSVVPHLNVMREKPFPARALTNPVYQTSFYKIHHMQNNVRLLLHDSAPNHWAHYYRKSLVWTERLGLHVRAVKNCCRPPSYTLLTNSNVSNHTKERLERIARKRAPHLVHHLL
jgi:hypothetical protein